VPSREKWVYYGAYRTSPKPVLVPTNLVKHAEALHEIAHAKRDKVLLSGNSRTRTLQRISRLARPYPGKDVAIAFDIWDSAEFLHKQASRKKPHENEPHWRIMWK
jgi:hypothetical protein